MIAIVTVMAAATPCSSSVTAMHSDPATVMPTSGTKEPESPRERGHRAGRAARTAGSSPSPRGTGRSDQLRASNRRAPANPAGPAWSIRCRAAAGARPHTHFRSVHRRRKKTSTARSSSAPATTSPSVAVSARATDELALVGLHRVRDIAGEFVEVGLVQVQRTGLSQFFVWSTKLVSWSPSSLACELICQVTNHPTRPVRPIRSTGCIPSAATGDRASPGSAGTPAGAARHKTRAR